MVAGLAVRAREGARSQSGTLGAHALPLEPTSNLVIDVAPAAAAAAAAATATATATGAAPAAASATGRATAPAPAAASARAATATTGESGRGISPVWFYIGLGATGLAGAATVVSGVDTANQHSHFVSDCKGVAGDSGCGTLASNGQSARTRTNVLLGVTAGLAALTAVTVFLVRWHDTRVGVSPAGVTATGRF